MKTATRVAVLKFGGSSVGSAEVSNYSYPKISIDDDGVSFLRSFFFISFFFCSVLSPRGGKVKG